MTGLQSIDFKLGSNAVNLAFEFSKNNRVLFVNPPLDRITLLKDKDKPEVQRKLDVIKGRKPGLIQINENLWALYPDVLLESINKIPFKPIFNFINRINNKRFSKPILDAVQKLDFTDIIWFNDSDFYRVFYLKEYIKISLFVYYTRDNMIATEYFKRHGIRMESTLMQKADAVVANSTFLQKAAARYNPHAYYVGQGCDVSAFDFRKAGQVPDDISVISKPVIGYTGALVSFRLDIELIFHLATQRPDWNIVLVGPEDATFIQSPLHTLPNIFFLGSKKQSELPNYVASFDVAINPQAINPVTIGNYPRKIDEYLAMGKPVVATYTEAMQVFNEHVYLAKTKGDFVHMIEVALAENSEIFRQKRESFARNHTWEANAREIYQVINSISKSKTDNTSKDVNKTTH